MRPIPSSANAHDPRWKLAFLELAEELVLLGAKGRIIEYFTGLRHKEVASLYRALRAEDPPPGPIAQGSARYFAVATPHTSSAWNLQGAIFLECYQLAGGLADYPLNRGWRLAVAFRAYQARTQKAIQVAKMKRLDVNQAYGLLLLVGFLALETGAELKLERCEACGAPYLLVTGEEREGQRCPVCTIHSNATRLAQIASPVSRQLNTAGRI